MEEKTINSYSENLSKLLKEIDDMMESNHNVLKKMNLSYLSIIDPEFFASILRNMKNIQKTNLHGFMSSAYYSGIYYDKGDGKEKRVILLFPGHILAFNIKDKIQARESVAWASRLLRGYIQKSFGVITTEEENFGNGGIYLTRKNLEWDDITFLYDTNKELFRRKIINDIARKPWNLVNDGIKGTIKTDGNSAIIFLPALSISNFYQTWTRTESVTIVKEQTMEEYSDLEIKNEINRIISGHEKIINLTEKNLLISDNDVVTVDTELYPHELSEYILQVIGIEKNKQVKIVFQGGHYIIIEIKDNNKNTVYVTVLSAKKILITRTKILDSKVIDEIITAIGKELEHQGAIPNCIFSSYDGIMCIKNILQSDKDVETIKFKLNILDKELEVTMNITPYYVQVPIDSLVNLLTSSPL